MDTAAGPAAAALPAALAPLAGLTTMSFELAGEQVGILAMNRPERANSQTVAMYLEYGAAARVLHDSGLRALIITGTGQRSFCPGFDIAELDVVNQMSAAGFLSFLEAASGGIAALRQLPFPVIAAIHGPAAGGGLAVALAADIRLAAPTAVFSAAFVRVGLSTGELGMSYWLSRLVGSGRAAEIGYTGRIVRAAEAEAIGLVNRIVPTPDLAAGALAMARLAADGDPVAIRLRKQAILRATEIGSFAAALDLEARAGALLAAGPAGT